MVCGCDRIIITDSRVTGSIDSKFLANDGNLYLDLTTTMTFDQIDSLVELDPLGDMKTEAVFGGSVPQTDKNQSILDRFIPTNLKEQNKDPMKVLAMNGHQILNVTSLNVIFYDEGAKAYEVELARGDDHWSVCASKLKLHTLDNLETVEFTPEAVRESWTKYRYQDGDIGIYFPLAFYGNTYRENVWITEDFRPAHSLQFLLEKGFCKCGWDFSSPIFDTDIGKQLWVYVLGKDFGQEKEALEASKFRMQGVDQNLIITGPGYGDYDALRSKFRGVSQYRFKLELNKVLRGSWSNNISEIILRVYKQYPDNGDTRNDLIHEVVFNYPQIEANAFDEFYTAIEWSKEIATAPQEDIVFTLHWREGNTDQIKLLSEFPSDSLLEMRYDLWNEPIRKTYVRGDTLDIAKIISEDLDLLQLLKGTVHLFGPGKLYLNHASREMKLFPPFDTKWNEEEIEGFFQYDEVISLTEDILCETMKVTAPELTTTRHNIVGYKNTNNPKVKEVIDKNGDEYLFHREVDFGERFEDDTEEWLNPVFEPVANDKLIKTVGARPPLLQEYTSDGIDLMWLVDNLNGNLSYNIGFVPFIAYGSFSNAGERVADQFFNYSFYFEDGWEDIPVSGQKPNALLLDGTEVEPVEPWLIYGEEPLKDLFSIFWREEFYRRALSSETSVNVNFSSGQLALLNYRKLYYIQYGKGFSGWLNRREFNFCKPHGTKLIFVPDQVIEPECIDPDTIPPVEPPCEDVNDPQIEWSLDEDCYLDYSQAGTIESNITSESWTYRYVDEIAFVTVPDPFKPNRNLYLRYEAETDSENCSIPVRTVFIDICQENTVGLEVFYTENDDCYQIEMKVEGCTDWTDVKFYMKDAMDDDESYEEVEPENPLDLPEERYLKICEPETDFCIKVVPELNEGCEIDPIEICIDLCPTPENIICNFTEVEGGFKFDPDFSSIYREILTETYDYDLDPDFSDPSNFDPGQVLTMVGTFYYRITLTFADCDPVVKVCEYTRDASDCELNTPDFECVVLSDGRLTIHRTGTIVTPASLDLIRYRKEGEEWQTWRGEPLDNCPYEIQRIYIPCNECPKVCSTIRRCDCTSVPEPPIGDCSQFWVNLKRYGDTLYAQTSVQVTGIQYIFLKDGVEVQNSALNTLDLSGGEGEYIVRAITQNCEDQDQFVYTFCDAPELAYNSHTEDGNEFTYIFDVEYPGSNPAFNVTHEYQISEAETQTEVLSYVWNPVAETITVVVVHRFGLNTVTVDIETDCGMATVSEQESIPCPENDPGLSKTYTFCEGCLAKLPAISFLDGDPDEGGTWFDLNASGKLNEDGTINFHELPVGEYEFVYTFNSDSELCIAASTLTINIIEQKSAGDSASINLCHNAGQTDLLSLLPGSPDEGGTWYTDDVIDGTIDLVNGKITPAATDIGKTITIAYSHNPQVSELPAGVTPAEYWLEFDGVDDYAEARNTSDLNFDLPIKIKWTYLGGGTTYPFSKSEQTATPNRYWMRVTGSDVGIGWSHQSNQFAPWSPNVGQTYEFEAYDDGGDFVQKIDGGEISRITTYTPESASSFPFRLGAYTNLSGNPVLFSQLNIYSFQVGTETFPMNEGTGTTITGSEGTVLDIYGATWNSEGVEECNCLSFSLLQITIVDCTPPIPCPDDSGLGIDIAESANGSPADAQWEDMLTITKTGTYEDAGVVATDDLYYSYDDGATWIAGSEVKDDDYYVKLTSAFQTTCSGGAGTGSHRMKDIQLSNGENVQEGQLRSRLNNFSANYTDIEPTDILSAAGASSSLIAERYFRWDVRHILNSGWELTLTHTHFDRTTAGGSCPSGSGSFGIHFYSGHKSGKRRILVERRITYNNGCDAITIQATFNPTLPTCPEVPSNVGFTIVDPYKIGNDEYAGSVSCKNSVPGSTSDTLYVFEQPTGANGYASNTYACSGGSRTLSFNYSYVFQRIIQFADCPPIILQHNYNSPTSCPTASISCEKDDANGRARATRSGNPFNLSSDYLQRKVGSGSWVNYTEGTWVNVSSSQTVSFRRVANFNNGCPQQQTQCSVTVNPPNWSLSISCSGNTIITSCSNLPGPAVRFFLYRDGVQVDSSATCSNFSINQNGNYWVKYKYNQYQEILSNTVNCGSAPCPAPVVALGACNISGSTISIPYSTSNVSSIGQLNVSSSHGSGQFTFNAGTGQGTITITGDPGQLHTVTLTATTSCGSDQDSVGCTLGCTSLQFDNIQCDFVNNQVTYDILTSPDTGEQPGTNGVFLSKPSSGRYRFRFSGLTGTITGSHSLQCNGISQSLNCQCPQPVANLDLTCTNSQVQYSLTVTNEQSVTGNYVIRFDNNPSLEFTINNTNSGTYSGTFPVTGLSHSWRLSYMACGQSEQITGNINCSCADPIITLTADCDVDELDIDFTVQNESNATSNYTVVVNGTAVKTVTKTGAGSYSTTVPVVSGSNNTVRVRVNSSCGGQINSNQVTANCDCPSSALSISGVSCDSEDQELTFNINQTNITGAVLVVNGDTIPITANPQVVQGQPGTNVITVSGQDSCSGQQLSDSFEHTCGCDQPSLFLSASCNSSGVISYSLVVTNENLTNGDYTIIRNGSNSGTITNTGAGTYNGTINVTPGTAHTIRIQVANNCGSNTQSNNVPVSCDCPASSIAISNVSCNSSTQMISFNLSHSNINNRVLKVNGNTISPIPSNPVSVQGQIGQNTIDYSGVDACTSAPKSAAAQINCLCTNNPSVNITSDSLSGTTLTVFFSTTNITSSGQITFIANGNIIGSKTNLGSGNWSVSFPVVSGTNNYSVSVQNSCGSDSDSDSYNYAPCTPPTITKINEGVDGNGRFYVTYSTTNCDTISATPTPYSGPTCGSGKTVRWNVSNSVLNWQVKVENDCGSATISGSFNPCTVCTGGIQDLGCTSSAVPLDVLFLVDGSTSFVGQGCGSGSDFPNALNAIRSTIQDLETSGPGLHRYAMAEYASDDRFGTNAGIRFGYPAQGGNYFVGGTSLINSLNPSSYTRQVCGCAQWQIMWLDTMNYLGYQLVRRPGVKLHLVIIHDSTQWYDSEQNVCSNGCSPSSLGCFYERNLFLSNTSNVEISVVQYDDGTWPDDKKYSATNATKGGSWTGGVISNPGDPQNFNPNNDKKRHFFFNSPSSSGIPGLVEDITSNCKLQAYVNSGCNWNVSSYNWTTSGDGEIISGQGTNTITTNGEGSYSLTITLSNGCAITDNYSYSSSFGYQMERVPVQVKLVERAPMTKAKAKTSQPKLKKASEYAYDYSELTEDQTKELISLHDKTKTDPVNKDLYYKKIMSFYNENVKSDYYFSCGCDSGEIDIIVNRFKSMKK